MLTRPRHERRPLCSFRAQRSSVWETSPTAPFRSREMCTQAAAMPIPAAGSRENRTSGSGSPTGERQTDPSPASPSSIRGAHTRRRTPCFRTALKRNGVWGS